MCSLWDHRLFLCVVESWRAMLCWFLQRAIGKIRLMHARDSEEMVFIDPSWNTDQGVLHRCEYLGGKPWCVMKVKEASCFCNRKACASALAGTIDRSPLAVDLSLSNAVGTRKKMIYASLGWSQGKLWWRLVAILTCKSFVWFGYRGERLIELSSSWFPPKFPLG